MVSLQLRHRRVIRAFIALAFITTASATAAAALSRDAHEAVDPPGEHDHEAAHADAATGDAGRPAHVRVWDAEGSLLITSWPDESGTLEGEDPSFETEGPYSWRGADGLVGAQPFWRDVVPIFTGAPPGTSLRLAGYRVPPTAIGEVVVPRVTEVPLAGTLSIDEADAMLGANRSTGRPVYFLGRIPIVIESENATEVAYRLDLRGARSFQVTRSVGLQITAEPDPVRGVVRLVLDAPEGSFVVHNNCTVLTDYLAPGYYILRSASADSLILTHYKSLVESRLEDKVVDIEVTFLDGEQEK